jgi:hypothetical protein
MSCKVHRCPGMDADACFVCWLQQVPLLPSRSSAVCAALNLGNLADVLEPGKTLHFHKLGEGDIAVL